ncbi:MAG: hypothetical protein AB1390_09320 [Nitrospirota bacterium]
MQKTIMMASVTLILLIITTCTCAQQEFTCLKNISPRIKNDVYMAKEDAGNWESGDEVLCVLEAECYENGDGSFNDWLHGPFGHVYWDIFEAKGSIDEIPDGADERRIQPPRFFRGPYRTHDGQDEWLDQYDYKVIEKLKQKYKTMQIPKVIWCLKYDSAGLWVWKDRQDAIILRLWESNSQSEDGTWFGRRNTVLGYEKIVRQETQVPRWYSFYEFTNDHPRKKTQKVAFRLLLQTMQLK